MSVVIGNDASGKIPGVLLNLMVVGFILLECALITYFIVLTIRKV